MYIGWVEVKRDIISRKLARVHPESLYHVRNAVVVFVDVGLVIHPVVVEVAHVVVGHDEVTFLEVAVGPGVDEPVVAVGVCRPPFVHADRGVYPK